MDFDRYINNGVIFRSTVDVVIEDSVSIGQGTIIDSGNHILGNCVIGAGCVLDSGNVIVDSSIGDNVSIIKSVIKNSTLGDKLTVGPFAHVHTNSKIGNNCRIGNFVEVKNASIGSNTKVAHLAYVGDVDVGEYCNVGCGAIFVNYDGKNKHRSTVGDSVFIGSNSNIIAPVNLCDNAYIAAGTTVTVDLPSDCLCIGRNRETIKENRSTYYKKPIKKYFGTDGIRGKYREFLTGKIAFYVGNYLGYSSNNGSIVVGRDNRPSGDALSISLKEGIISAGANVIDLGIVPTPGVAYATKLAEANYGIVITASHNGAEYNGIKIFNYDGRKLTDVEEIEIEKFIDKDTPYFCDNIGDVIDGYSLRQGYIEHLSQITNTLKGLNVVVDCANGATSQYAPKILHDLGCSVIAINKSDDGSIINLDCGALYPEKCSERVLAVNADVGLTFDGDGDRLLAIDEMGNIVDGDDIVYIITQYLLKKSLLPSNVVVGTTMTNMGMERALKQAGVDLIRADVGDHYVMQEMAKNNAIIGGEQSGHVILNSLSSTGDGIQTAIMLLKIMRECALPLSALKEYTRYPQLITSVEVIDKRRVLNNQGLQLLIAELLSRLGSESRIIVRPSGTEPKIRIMVECISQDLAQIAHDKLLDYIRTL